MCRAMSIGHGVLDIACISDTYMYSFVCPAVDPAVVPVTGHSENLNEPCVNSRGDLAGLRGTTGDKHMMVCWRSFYWAVLLT